MSRLRLVVENAADPGTVPAHRRQNLRQTRRRGAPGRLRWGPGQRRRWRPRGGRSSAPTCCSGCTGGDFVSMTDPPAGLADRRCRTAASTGAGPCSPVPPETTTSLLVSPIILEDHPTLAAQSPGVAVRLHRDRRDPHPADPHHDRAGEGGGDGPPTRGPPRSSTAASSCRRRTWRGCTAPCTHPLGRRVAGRARSAAARARLGRRAVVGPRAATRPSTPRPTR